MFYVILLIIILVLGIGLYALNKKVSTLQESVQKWQIKESRSTALAEERDRKILSDKNTIESLNREKEKLITETATLQNSLEIEKNSLETINERHTNDLANTRKTFSTEFENLSNKILKETSQEFADNSKTKINELLTPLNTLNTTIETFKSNLQHLQTASVAERLTLKANIKSMVDSSSLLANETGRLTKALKGDVQRQGAWGELILETVLEFSGLKKGIQYTVHGGGLELEDSSGKRQYPDVIIHLPDNRHFIIDSKFSYIPYDNYLEAETEKERASCLEKLVQSVQTHVKGLSEKKYSFAENLNTPDLTLMFIPIEAIFSLVIQKKQTLFEDAWKKSIVIVCPANLLAILRTLDSLWTLDQQNKNTQQIAHEGALLYDKFVGLLKCLKSLDTSLNGANKSYHDVMLKLEGRGNIITKIENLKKLGLKTKGTIPNPKEFLDEELIELDDLEEDEPQILEFNSKDTEEEPLSF